LTAVRRSRSFSRMVSSRLFKQASGLGHRTPADLPGCVGGAKRAERLQRIRVVHGDVVVWGGPGAALVFHGVGSPSAAHSDRPDMQSSVIQQVERTARIPCSAGGNMTVTHRKIVTHVLLLRDTQPGVIAV
jgi:hypothetical protein